MRWVINMKCYLYITLVLIIVVLPVHASETARDFLKGVSAYDNENYSESARIFERIADMGIVNGKLYYNIGNSYFKSGDVGQAVLWYERAMKLIPNDPDLRFNYEYVNEFVQDKAEEKKSPVLKVLFFWKHMMGKRAVQWTGIICVVLFCCVASVRMIKGKRLFPAFQVGLIVLSALFVFTAIYDFYDETYNRYAVILSDQVSVRSGLSDGATELFVLHKGTKVKIEQARNDYLKIRFTDGKTGWMKKAAAGII